jgi:hypothetical protein
MGLDMIEGMSPNLVLYSKANCLRYWDVEVDPENYSFVDFAISRGYSVFFYDRLGVGKSSK